MDLKENPALVGGIGGVVGLLLGLLLGMAVLGKKVEEGVRMAMGPANEASQAQSEAVAALTDRIAKLEGAVAEGNSAASEMVGTVADEVKGLGAAISETASQQTEAMKESLKSLSESLLTRASAVVETVTLAEGEGYRAGQTASFAEGALRVFVSGVMDGAARLAVNGLQTQNVAIGESITAQSGEQSCSVSVTAVQDGKVGLEGTCG